MNKYSSSNSVSGSVYFLYIIYTISFFLHLASRVPGIEVIRPDLLLAAAILILLFIESNKIKTRLYGPCHKIIFALIIYVIISVPFIEWPGSVIRDNFSEFVKPVLFFYFSILILDTDKRLKLFIIIFILCQLFRVFEPLYLHETTGYWGSRTFLGGGDFAGRLAGAPHDVINPNGLAFVIATVFPFLHFLWGNGKWFAKLSYYFMIAPLLYALVLTLSRSGFIAMMVVGWNIFINSKKKILIIIAVIVIAVISWANMSQVQRERYLSLTGDDTVAGAATVDSRLRGFKKDFVVGLERPVFGHGVGTSKEAIYHKYGSAYVSHILYLEAFIELGLIGFIIYMIFLKRIYSTIHRARSNFANASISTHSNINDNNNSYIYYKNLLISLRCCFWMFLIFSFAQYGVSEYHWYVLAALCTLCERKSNLLSNNQSGKVSV